MPIVWQTPGFRRNSPLPPKRLENQGFKARQSPYTGDRPLSEFDFDIQNLSAAQLNALMAGIVAAGTLYCFLGYRTLRFVIALTGFLVAGAVAGALVLWVTEGNELAAIIGLAIGGICGAFALSFLYKAGIFLLGMLGAGLIGNYAMEPAGDAWVPLAVLAIAIVGGLVALVLEKPVMLVATSVLGAWMLVAAGTYFISGGGELELIAEALEAEEPRKIMLAAWAVLSAAGILSQFATTRGKTVVVKKPVASSG